MEPSIVIIGAGPAGCSASMCLSRYGITHTILEKSTFPRDKICGDALSGKVVEVLKKHDPHLVTTMAMNSTEFLGSWGVKFVAPNGKHLDIPFKSDMHTEPHAPGFISRRVHFDNFLVNQLDTRYARLITGATVTDIHGDPQNRAVYYSVDGEERQLKAQVIIAADGDRSIVVKRLAPAPLEPEHYCAGIRAYYQGVRGMHPQNFIELHFLKELLPGYLWIFPLPDGGCNVGAGMLTSMVSRHRVNLKEQMLKAIEENPNIRNRFVDARLEGPIQGWGLPLGSKKRRLSGDGYLLCGDAASLIDPFTGEGIGNALYSGYFAGEAIAQTYSQGDFSDQVLYQEYDTPLYHRLWDELKLSHTLQRLSKYPSLFNLVVNRANGSPTLRHTLSAVFEDLDLRASFRNPNFWWNILRGK